MRESSPRQVAPESVLGRMKRSGLGGLLPKYLLRHIKVSSSPIDPLSYGSLDQKSAGPSCLKNILVPMMPFYLARIASLCSVVCHSVVTTTDSSTACVVEK